MPAYTTPLAIPYPTSLDTLRDAVSTIPQQAAEKVNDAIGAISGVNPSNWTAVTAGPVWSMLNTRVVRRAGMACLHLHASRATQTSWASGEVICTVPAGFRPLPLSGATLDPRAFMTITGTGAPTAVYIETATGIVRPAASQPAGSNGLLGYLVYAI